MKSKHCDFNDKTTVVFSFCYHYNYGSFCHKSTIAAPAKDRLLLYS